MHHVKVSIDGTAANGGNSGSHTTPHNTRPRDALLCKFNDVVVDSMHARAPVHFPWPRRGARMRAEARRHRNTW